MSKLELDEKKFSSNIKSTSTSNTDKTNKTIEVKKPTLNERITNTVNQITGGTTLDLGSTTAYGSDAIKSVSNSKKLKEEATKQNAEWNVQKGIDKITKYSNEDANYKSNLLSYSKGDTTLTGSEYNAKADGWQSQYNNAAKGIEDLNKSYENGTFQGTYNDYLNSYNTYHKSATEAYNNLVDLSDYEVGYNTGAKDQIEANKTRINELYNQMNGLDERDKVPLTQEIAELSKQNYNLGKIAEGIDIINENDTYDWLKENGSEEEIKNYESLLASKDDSWLQRRAKNFSTQIVTMPLQAVADVTAIAKDVGDLTLANDIEKQTEQGFLDDNTTAKLVAKANKLRESDIDSSAAASIREWRQRKKQEIQYGTTDVGKVTGEIIDSAIENTARRLVFGEVGSLAVMGVSTFGESYYENIQKGYSKEASLFNSVLKGTVSVMSEKLPNEKWFKILKDTSMGDLQTNFVSIVSNLIKKQALPEMLEEVEEGIGDHLSDAVTKLIWKDEIESPEFNAGDIVRSALMAGASAMVSGGAAIAIGSSIGPIQTQQQYNQADVELALVDDAMSKTTDPAILKGLEEVKAQGEERKAEFEQRPMFGAVTYPSDMDVVVPNDTQTTKDLMYEPTLGDAAAAQETAERFVQATDEIVAYENEVKLNQAREEITNNRISIDESLYASLDDEHKRQVQRTNEVAKEHKAKVNFLEHIYDEKGVEKDASFNRKTKTIDINVNGKMPEVSSLIHEYAHFSEGAKNYGSLRQSLVDIIGKEKFNNAVNNLLTNYWKIESPTEQDIDEAQKEVTAIYVQEYLGTEEFADKLVKYNKNFVYRIIKDLQSIFTKGGNIGKLEANLMRAISKAEQSMEGTSYSEGLTTNELANNYLEEKEKLTTEIADVEQKLIKSIFEELGNGEAENQKELENLSSLLKNYGETEFANEISTMNKTGFVFSDKLIDYYNNTGDKFKEALNNGEFSKYQNIFDNLKNLENSRNAIATLEGTMEQPSGEKDSEGNDISIGQTIYFDESKIRDAKGRLIKVFHTSPSFFDKFDPRGTFGYRFKGIVNYFSSNKDVSGSYVNQLYDKVKKSGVEDNSQKVKELNNKIKSLYKLMDSLTKKTRKQSTALYVECSKIENAKKLLDLSTKLEKANEEIFDEMLIDDKSDKKYSHTFRKADDVVVQLGLIGKTVVEFNRGQSMDIDTVEEYEDYIKSRFDFIARSRLYYSDETLDEYLDMVKKCSNVKITDDDVKTLLLFKDYAVNMDDYYDFSNVLNETVAEADKLTDVNRGYQYGGYLLARNPYILDGEYYDIYDRKMSNANWNTIQESNYGVDDRIYDLASAINTLVNDVRDTKSFGTSKYAVNSYILTALGPDLATFVMKNPILLASVTNEIMNSVGRGEDFNFDMARRITHNYFNKNKGNKFAVQLETNDVVKAIESINYFLEQYGEEPIYDAVWFKGITDSGGSGEGARAPSDIIAMFESNRFKIEDNLTPTVKDEYSYSSGLKPSDINVDDEFDSDMGITQESVDSFIKEPQETRKKYQKQDGSLDYRQMMADKDKQESKVKTNRQKGLNEFQNKYGLTDEQMRKFVTTYNEYKAEVDGTLRRHLKTELNKMFPYDENAKSGKYAIGRKAFSEYESIFKKNKSVHGSFQSLTDEQRVIDADNFVKEMINAHETEGVELMDLVEDYVAEGMFDIRGNGLLSSTRLIDEMRKRYGDDANEAIDYLINNYETLRSYSGQIFSSNKNVYQMSDSLDRLLYVNAVKNNIEDEGSIKYGKRWNEFSSKIDEIFKNHEGALYDAKGEDFKRELSKFVNDIYDILPDTFADKLNKFRYWAMLSSWKTPIANALGNEATKQTYKLKDVNDALVQEVLLKLSKKKGSVWEGLFDESQRTATNNKNSETTKVNKQVALEWLDEMNIDDDTKFSNKKGINFDPLTQRRVGETTKDKVEGLAKKVKDVVTNDKSLLDKASELQQMALSDRRALEDNFIIVLNNIAQARNIDLTKIKVGSEAYYKLSGEALDEAKERVHHNKTQASKILDDIRKRSYKSINIDENDSALTQGIETLIKSVKKKANKGNVVAKGVDTTARFLTNFLMPFTRTNMSLVKKFIEFSPVSGALTLAQYKTMAQNVADGKMTTTEFTDKIAKGLTGAEIGVVGLALALAGVLKYDEDDEDYSGQIRLKLPNGDFITVDDLDPVSSMLARGAIFVQTLTEYGVYGGAWDEVLRAAYGLFQDQALDSFSSTFTFLSHLADLRKGENSYGDDYQFGNFLGDVAYSYLSSYIPAILADISKYVVQEVKQTYDDDVVKYFSNRMMNRTPLRGLLENKTDATGNVPTYNEPYTDFNELNKIITNFLSKSHITDEEGNIRRVTKGMSSNKMSEEQTKNYQELVDKYSYTDEDNNGYSDKHWLRASVPSNFYFDGKQVELASADKSEYGKEWSSVWTSSASALESNKTYQALNEENKVDVIYNAQTMATRLESAKYGKANGLDLSDTQKEALALEGYYTKDGKIDSNKLALISMATSVDNNNHSLFRDTYSDGETVNGSSALNVLKMYQENGVLDEIIKYCKNNDVDYSAFGLSKDIVKSYQKKDVIITMDDEDRLSYYEVRRDISEIRQDLEDTKEVGKDVDYKTPTIEAINNSNLTDKVKNYVYDSYYESDFTKITNTLSVDDKTKYNVKIANATIESDKDENGKTISGSKSKKLVEEYKKLGVLNELVNYVKTNGLEPSIIGLTKSDYNSLIGKSSSSSVSRGTKTYKDKLLSAMSSVSSKSTPSLGKYYTSQDFKDSKNSTSNSSYMKAYKKQMAKMLKNL